VRSKILHLGSIAWRKKYSSEQRLSRREVAPLANDSGGAPRHRLVASRDLDDAEAPEHAPLPQSFSTSHHGRPEKEEWRGAVEELQHQDTVSLLARSSRSHRAFPLLAFSAGQRRRRDTRSPHRRRTNSTSPVPVATMTSRKRDRNRESPRLQKDANNSFIGGGACRPHHDWLPPKEQGHHEAQP
jgi:hypothetical protein